MACWFLFIDIPRRNRVPLPYSYLPKASKYYCTWIEVEGSPVEGKRGERLIEGGKDTGEGREKDGGGGEADGGGERRRRG